MGSSPVQSNNALSLHVPVSTVDIPPIRSPPPTFYIVRNTVSSPTDPCAIRLHSVYKSREGAVRYARQLAQLYKNAGPVFSTIFCSPAPGVIIKIDTRVNAVNGLEEHDLIGTGADGRDLSVGKICVRQYALLR